MVNTMKNSRGVDPITKELIKIAQNVVVTDDYIKGVQERLRKEEERLSLLPKVDEEFLNRTYSI